MHFGCDDQHEIDVFNNPPLNATHTGHRPQPTASATLDSSCCCCCVHEHEHEHEHEHHACRVCCCFFMPQARSTLTAHVSTWAERLDRMSSTVGSLHPNLTLGAADKCGHVLYDDMSSPLPGIAKQQRARHAHWPRLQAQELGLKGKASSRPNAATAGTGSAPLPPTLCLCSSSCAPSSNSLFGPPRAILEPRTHPTSFISPS